MKNGRVAVRTSVPCIRRNRDGVPGKKWSLGCRETRFYPRSGRKNVLRERGKVRFCGYPISRTFMKPLPAFVLCFAALFAPVLAGQDEDVRLVDEPSSQPLFRDNNHD